MVEDLSALGLRHVGYAVPTESWFAEKQATCVTGILHTVPLNKDMCAPAIQNCQGLYFELVTTCFPMPACADFMD